jgi:hypothetical protein
MEPPGFKRRPMERSLRPDGPLVYEQGSDPSLVRRAHGGDPNRCASLSTSQPRNALRARLRASA